MTPRQDYTRALNAVASRYGALEDDTVQRAIELLREASREIAAELATADSFTAYRLRQLQASVARLMDEFQTRLSAHARAAFGQVYALGGDSVVAPLKALGVGGALYSPSMAQANAVLDFSADLIKGITDQARASINTQIRMAVLGQRSPFDAMQQITKALGVPANVIKARPAHGAFPATSGISAKAETDLRTEMQRVFNLATHSQQQATARQVPGLLKAWTATADSRTRPSHLDAHTRYRAQPIPVDEPFVLHDARDGRVELMYPCDPAAPVGVTANCRCRQVTVHPAYGLIGSSLDGRIAAELGRRGEAVLA